MRVIRVKGGREEKEAGKTDPQRTEENTMY